MKLKKTTGRTSSISNPALINPHSSVSNIKTWRVADQSGTETNILADRVLDDYMISILPSAGQSDYSPAMLRTDLNFLNRKLETVRKSVTSWDVYNILGVAETPAEVNSWLNSLAPNSSFIINLKDAYTDLNNNKYSVGDIVFKDILGTNHIIQAQGAGVYFPQKLLQFYQVQKKATEPTDNLKKAIWNKIKDKQIISKSDMFLTDAELKAINATRQDWINAVGGLIADSNYLQTSNTYELTYTFSDTVPPVQDNANIYTGVESELPDPAKEMIASLGVETENNPYGFRKTLAEKDNLTFKLKKYDGKIIQPVIYTFLTDDKNSFRERIYLDSDMLTYTINEEEKVTITNNSPLIIAVEVR